MWFGKHKTNGMEVKAADIMNIAGNIISGQGTRNIARALSTHFGKIVQIKESVFINSNDTSVSKSGQVDFAILASKNANLSSDEFVEMVADDPDMKIKLKRFIAKPSVILNFKKRGTKL